MEKKDNKDEKDDYYICFFFLKMRKKIWIRLEREK